MVREVVTLCVGQCGIQMGQRIWEQYCAEHDISTSGRIQSDSDHNIECLFEETKHRQYCPRNLMVDLEPNVIDDVKTSKYSAIFHPDFLLQGEEDAANNFYRGHYDVGKGMMDKVNDRLRKLVDNCDNVQGFMFNHSVGGGTGSGLGALILERICVDYRKKTKIGFHVYPSPTISTNVVEPYNALLTTHWLLDHTEVSVVMDNESIYEICQKHLDLYRPSYDTVNRLIAKVVSSMTAGLRFEGGGFSNLQEFQTNLVPFPRLHFMVTSMAPIVTESKKETMPTDVQSLTEHCFSSQSFFVKIADFDPEEDKYMAMSMNYRGDVNPKEATLSVQSGYQELSFVEWVPTGFKVGYTETAAAKVEGDVMAYFDKNAVMIGNNTGISRVFSERVSKKYDMLYSQRAFIHWFYLGPEGEFPEAREDLGFLEKDYLDVLSELATDEEDYSDSDES